MSTFVKPTEDYRRNLDIKSAYLNDMTLALARATGQSEERCREYVERVTSEGGRLPAIDPPMKYVGRDKNNDRHLKVTTFLKYLDTVTKNNLILSPSLTVYQNADVKRSMTAKYIAGNVIARSKAKSEMFAADEVGNKALSEYKNNEQQTRKTKNNALSGAHCSDSTPLFLDTIHSSLTSTCRSASGYGNANNEKILAGSRHYWNWDVVAANIASIATNTDLVAFEAMMTKYNVHYPTADEAMTVIHRGSQMYWRNTAKMDVLYQLVSGLAPVERAAFVYIGDLYHLARYNDELMRTMITKLSAVCDVEVEDPKQYLDTLTEEAAALVSLLCGKYMGGKKLKAFDSFEPAVQRLIGGTAKNMYDTLAEYEDLIKNILVTENIPASLANLPTIVRRCAITSDTDSTIFTVQDWIRWFNGSISFSDEAVNAGHAIAFLTSASITHVLAIMSANMGVRKQQLHQYAMKSEYYFPAFSLTSRAKTYYGYMAAQEGRVFVEPELELKGAVLKGSKSPTMVRTAASDMIRYILDTTIAGEKLSLNKALRTVAQLERDIIRSIEAGDSEFYKSAEIKTPDSYKADPERSPYFHYLLWEEVFAPKYGNIEAVPYGAIKVTIQANNRTEFASWLESIEDQALRLRLIEFLAKHNKTNLTMINVPKAMVMKHGVPKELIQGIAIRKIVIDLCEPMYVLLESMGYFMLDGKQRRLISDTVFD